MKNTFKILKIAVLIIGLLSAALLVYKGVTLLPKNEPEPAQTPAVTEAPVAETEPPVVTPSPEPVPTEAETTEVTLCDNPAPSFTVLDVDGNSVEMSQFYGKPIILNFWATWCPPCRSELPHFNAAAQTYEGSITFMMIDLADGQSETVDGAKQFVSENGYSFPLYFDTEYNALNAYPTEGIPQTVFIRADGSILEIVVGSMSAEVLQSYIDQLLQ